VVSPADIATKYPHPPPADDVLQIRALDTLPIAARAQLSEQPIGDTE